jgi:hypothetical protein
VGTIERRTFHSTRALVILLAALSGCATDANRPNVTLNAGCVSCMVNVNGAAKPPAKPSELKVTVPNDPTRPDVYIWHNRSYEGAEAFLDVVRAEVAAEVEKVKPSSAPPYGSLRVAFPKRVSPTLSNLQNPAGAVEAETTWVRYQQVIDEARLRALEKSRLFAAVASETDNVGILDPGSADFALWFDRGVWRLRYHSANPVDFPNSPNVSAWIGIVNVMAKNAKAIRPGAYTAHIPQGDGKVWFTLQGTDYFSVEPMIPVMNAEFQRQAREVSPLTARLGGKAKIVLASFTVGNTTYKFKDPENARMARQAGQEFGLAAARGRVEALRRSNIFDSITVETADVSDVPVAGYDYVLWQPATSPWTWRYRIAGKNDAFTLVIPTGTEIPQFPEIVRDNIQKTKASP